MTKDSLVHHVHVGEIHDRNDLRRTFREIHEALEKAQTREDLTELYKQAVYMILLTHSSPLDERDRELKSRREAAEREFPRAVRAINRRAKKLGLEANYNEDRERLAANGYRTEGDNLLDAQRAVGIVREEAG